MRRISGWYAWRDVERSGVNGSRSSSEDEYKSSDAAASLIRGGWHVTIESEYATRSYSGDQVNAPRTIFTEDSAHHSV